MTEGRLDVGGYENSAGFYEDGGLTERTDEISLAGITSRPAIHRALAESGFAARKE